MIHKKYNVSCSETLYVDSKKSARNMIQDFVNLVKFQVFNLCKIYDRNIF